jgi:hypothetical protein
LGQGIDLVTIELGGLEFSTAAAAKTRAKS